MRSRSPTNSSRKRRRRLLCVREYRANSAPFTTSGRLTSANTGWSRFVKYGRRTAASSAVNCSTVYTPTASAAVPVLRRGIRPMRIGGRRSVARRWDPGPSEPADTPAARRPRAAPSTVGSVTGRRGPRRRPRPPERPAARTSTLGRRRVEDPGVRHMVAAGQARPHRAALAARERVHLHLDAAVARDGRAGRRRPAQELAVATTTPVAAPSSPTRAVDGTRTPS